MKQVKTMDQESIQAGKQQPWALVTGASSGIGAEFCRQLAAKGYQLVLVARRADRLQAVADEVKTAHGTNSLIITADLSQSDSCQAVVNCLEEENIDIEMLVNNAGYGLPGSFHVPDWRQHADLIQVMVTAVCELTWRLLPGMRERGQGYIINVASVAALIPPSSGHTLYAASKSFLIKFSETLALENADNGVKVTAVCPGFTYTEFHDVNNTRALVSKLPSYLWLDAEFVVSDTLKAIFAEKVKPSVVPGRLFKALIWVNRYLPWLGRPFINRNARKYRITE